MSEAGPPPLGYLLLFTEIGVTLLVTTLLGALAGHWLGGRLGTDPIFAMQRMMRDWPDVVVLDLEMPRMDGLTFLRRIMAARQDNAAAQNI